jgi:hypothetical protein
MFGNSVLHSLTNLAAGLKFDLSVEVGQDVVAAAKAELAERGVPEAIQQGFYVSVFPTGLDELREKSFAEGGHPGAGSSAADDRSRPGTDYDAPIAPEYDFESGADPAPAR